MDSQLSTGVVTVLMGIVGVATLAVIFAKNSNAPNVIQAGASGFGNALAVAVSPVTGNNVQASLAYPTAFG